MKKKNWTVDGHSAKSVLSLFQPKNSCMNTMQNYIMEVNPSVITRTNRSNFKKDQEKGGFQLLDLIITELKSHMTY